MAGMKDFSPSLSHRRHVIPNVVRYLTVNHYFFLVGFGKRCIFVALKYFFNMDTIAIKEVKRMPKPAKEETVMVMPRRKRGLLGILKGKIHYDDAIFNLD